MAVDVTEERLLAAVEDLHRAAGAQGQQAGVDLHGQVLAGAEGAAHAGQGVIRTRSGQVEAGRQLVAVDVQPLGRDVQVDPALAVGDGQAGLGAEEGLVLHADLVFAGDHDSAAASWSPWRMRMWRRTLPLGWSGGAPGPWPPPGSTSGSRTS